MLPRENLIHALDDRMHVYLLGPPGTILVALWQASIHLWQKAGCRHVLQLLLNQATNFVARPANGYAGQPAAGGLR